MMLNAALVTSLFDALPDVVYFAKDRAGCYTQVNATLVRRLGRRHAGEVLGRSALELFPAPLGARYAAQDAAVLSSGVAVREQLELHLYPNRAPGWCLTDKLPLREGRRTVGVLGISRDLGKPDTGQPGFARLAAASEHLHRHYADPLPVRELARRAGFSVAQFERRVQRVFGLTPRSLLAKIRVDAAMRLLLQDHASIAAIAQCCGYSDHSAFSRQFRAAVGMPPRAYRALHGSTS